MRACAEHAHTHAGDTRSLRSLACSPFPPVPLHHSHHKTQPTPSAADTRSLRSLAGYPAAPHSLRSPTGSRPRYARLGFLLPTRGGNPRAPSAGLGTGLRNRLSTSLGPIPSDPPPVVGFRSRRSLPLARLRPVWLSLLISLVGPVPLVGVAGIAGAPAPLRALTRPRPLKRPPRSCALMGAAPLAGRESGPSAPRPALRSGRRYVTRLRGPSVIAGTPRCGSPSAPRCRQPSPAGDIL